MRVKEDPASDANTHAFPAVRSLCVRRIVLSLFEHGMLPSDLVFDRLLAAPLRDLSWRHWTPVAVAARVASWLDELGAESLLDIGSGAGKLCVVGALSGRARFLGLEQRAELVHAAADLASFVGVDSRVRFVHGEVARAKDLPKVDAYYLYNPFGEAIYAAEMRIADDVQFGLARYLRDVEATEELLDAAAPGTILVTYNGFGGVAPIGFELAAIDVSHSSPLELWRKATATRDEERARKTRSM